MKKSRKTKRALIPSLLAVILCVAMLVGTTFAWFTDTASTSVNKIQAGTLDVALVDESGASLEGKTLKWAAFDNRDQSEILWEPGCTYKTQNFYIENKGNLNLKFKVLVSGIDGDAKLLDVTSFTAMAKANQVHFNTGAISITVGEDEEFDLLKGYAVDTLIYGTKTFTEYTLEPGDKVGPIAISGHMDENAGNEYQKLSIDGIGITIIATQGTGDEDSYNGTYDEEAKYFNTDTNGAILIGSAGDLRYFAATVNADNDAYAGKTIKLTADIDLEGAEWTPINMTGRNADQDGGQVTFDGQGHTISNFKVTAGDGEKNTGLFGMANFSTIKDLNVDKATVTGINHVGAIVGHGMATTIDNCKVTNSTITTAVWWDPAVGGYNDGDKAGAIAGWLDEGIHGATNCEVDNCTITGYRDIGGLIGYVGNGSSSTATVTGNTVKNTTITQDKTKEYEPYKTDVPTTVEKIVGRYYSGLDLDGNTATENVNVVK